MWRDQFHAAHRCRPCCWPRGGDGQRPKQIPIARRFRACSGHPRAGLPQPNRSQLAAGAAGRRAARRRTQRCTCDERLVDTAEPSRPASLTEPAARNKAWGVQPVMAGAEPRGLPYLFRLRTDAILDTMALALGFPADVERLFPAPGISVAETYASACAVRTIDIYVRHSSRDSKLVDVRAMGQSCHWPFSPPFSCVGVKPFHLTTCSSSEQSFDHRRLSPRIGDAQHRWASVSLRGTKQPLPVSGGAA
jgi:hypothetical protein